MIFRPAYERITTFIREEAQRQKQHGEQEIAEIKAGLPEYRIPSILEKYGTEAVLSFCLQVHDANLGLHSTDAHRAEPIAKGGLSGVGMKHNMVIWGGEKDTWMEEELKKLDTATPVVLRQGRLRRTAVQLSDEESREVRAKNMLEHLYRGLQRTMNYGVIMLVYNLHDLTTEELMGIGASSQYLPPDAVARIKKPYLTAIRRTDMLESHNAFNVLEKLLTAQQEATGSGNTFDLISNLQKLGNPTVK